MSIPTIEEPSQHLTFDPLGSAIPISEKGRVSIGIYNLNTARLNDQRRYIIEEMTDLLKIRNKAKTFATQPGGRELLEKINARIRKGIDRSAPYAAAARAVVKNPEIFGM